MITRSAIFFPMVMAGFLAMITYWVSQTVEQQIHKLDGSSRHDPDYTMNHFVTTQTDQTGSLRYVLAATEMVHYPDDNSTVLQRPRFTQFTTNKPYTQIEGLRGYVSDNGEEIELVDNVKVTRQAFEEHGEMQVATEKLTILPDQDLVKTDSPVVITQAPKTVIHATGMVYNKKEQTVQLLNRVKAHYEKPETKNAATSKAKTAPAAGQTKVSKAKEVISKTKPADKRQKITVTNARSTR
jgi:lipopolysaccharide export system protein LptC